MNSPSSPVLQEALETAHLMYLRKQYAEAYELLETLRSQYPADTEVQELLAQVAIHQPPKPTPSEGLPTEGAVENALTKNLSPLVSTLAVIGTCFCVFGLWRLSISLPIAFGQGWGASVMIEGGKNSAHAYPTPVGQVVFLGGICVGIGLVCFGIVYRTLRKEW